MRVFPFAGTRYAPAAGNPGRLAAPPFDQIDDPLRARLQTEPLQFAQLTRPDPAAQPSPAAHAAALHRRWRADGLTRRDGEAAWYPYEILLAGGGSRLGLCALVGLETPESGIVVPHEQTVARTVGERLELLRATGCDLEPILILADDRGALDDALAATVAGGKPLVEHSDLDGHTHRLYRDPQSGYAELVATATAVIADGNHRWQVARSHAAARGVALGEAGPEVPQAVKLAVVTSLEAPGVTIDPIHRGLTAAVELEAAAALAAARSPWQGPDSGAAFAAAVAAAPQPALGVTTAAGTAEIWRLGPSSLPAERAALVAYRLHDDLLPRLGLSPAAATDGTLTYRSDPDVLWREVAAGRYAAGLFLPPMSPPAFAAAMAAGGLMPPKSTRFLPKLVSGLVWFEHRPVP